MEEEFEDKEEGKVEENKVEEIDIRDVILARYTGEYNRATLEDFTTKKTSQDIVMDLRPIADFSVERITKFLIRMGYTIDFEGDTPYWLLKRENMSLQD